MDIDKIRSLAIFDPSNYRSSITICKKGHFKINYLENDTDKNGTLYIILILKRVQSNIKTNKPYLFWACVEKEFQQFVFVR